MKKMTTFTKPQLKAILKKRGKRFVFSPNPPVERVVRTWDEESHEKKGDPIEWGKIRPEQLLELRFTPEALADKVSIWLCSTLPAKGGPAPYPVTEEELIQRVAEYLDVRVESTRKKGRRAPVLAQ